jgi:hypothetical protein
MEEAYGGIESWSEEIKRAIAWVPPPYSWLDEGENEVSFNSRRAMDRLKEVTICVNWVAVDVSKLMALQSHQAQHDMKTAQKSRLLSFAGLFLIAIGFALQVVGAWPC